VATRKTDFAARLALLDRSRAVTEILKLAERSEVISFAGGLPDPSAFPMARIRESMERVLRDEGEASMNYGPNPGNTKLRDWIAERMTAREKVPARRENILVTSGGVEALNLVAMALLDEGDTVLVEAPTYMIALHIAHAYRARVVAVPTDEEGLDADALEERLRALERAGTCPRFLYVIPSFQNPSGATESESRRHRIVSLCERFKVRIVEDHAYAELDFDGSRLPSLKSLAPDNVIFIHTFSKIFGPGVRLGWVVAEPELVDALGLCKLGTDQCANSLTQRLAYDYGSRGFIDKQVEASIELYRLKRDVMEDAMKRHFPSEAHWVHPRGGFFVWVRLPESVDTEMLLPMAIEKEKTAFVAGTPFYDDGSGRQFMRLAFSFVSADKIEEGVKRLGRALTW
jgi:2-aminoadipate transaminase